MAADSGGSEKKSIRGRIGEKVSRLAEEAEAELKQTKTPAEGISSREIAQQALIIALRQIAEERRIAAIRQRLGEVSQRLDQASVAAHQRVEQSQERARIAREEEQRERREREARERLQILQEFADRAINPQGWEAEINSRGYGPASFEEDRRDLERLRAAIGTAQYDRDPDAFGRIRTRLYERLREESLRSRLSRPRRERLAEEFVNSPLGQDPQRELDWANRRRGFTTRDQEILNRLEVIRRLRPQVYEGNAAYERLRQRLHALRRRNTFLGGRIFPLNEIRNWLDRRDLGRELRRRIANERAAAAKKAAEEERVKKITHEEKEKLKKEELGRVEEERQRRAQLSEDELRALIREELQKEREAPPQTPRPATHGDGAQTKSASAIAEAYKTVQAYTPPRRRSFIDKLRSGWGDIQAAFWEKSHIPKDAIAYPWVIIETIIKFFTG